MLGFFPFVSGDACLPYHFSHVNELYIHVDVLGAQFLCCSAHKTKRRNSVLMSGSNFESSLKMKYPRAPVLCGTKSCVENKYAYMQPHHLPLVFALVCVGVFFFFATASSLHRFQVCTDLNHTITHSHKFAPALLCCSEQRCVSTTPGINQKLFILLQCVLKGCNLNRGQSHRDVSFQTGVEVRCDGSVCKAVTLNPYMGGQ